MYGVDAMSCTEREWDSDEKMGNGGRGRINKRCHYKKSPK